MIGLFSPFQHLCMLGDIGRHAELRLKASQQLLSDLLSFEFEVKLSGTYFV